MNNARRQRYESMPLALQVCNSGYRFALAFAPATVSLKSQPLLAYHERTEMTPMQTPFDGYDWRQHHMHDALKFGHRLFGQSDSCHAHQYWSNAVMLMIQSTSAHFVRPLSCAPPS